MGKVHLNVGTIGHYRVGATDLYVNRGIGMEGGWMPRVRFWARPELAVIDVFAPR